MITMQVWYKALELALKFVPMKAGSVGSTVAERLAEISRYESAGEAYLSIERYKECIDMFIAGDKWDRARVVAREHAPQFEQRVENEYVESLKKRGKAEELANVDVIAGLDLLANRGQWSKCLQTAENEVNYFWLTVTAFLHISCLIKC